MAVSGMVGVYERYENDCFETSVEIIAEEKAELELSRDRGNETPTFKRNLTTSLHTYQGLVRQEELLLAFYLETMNGNGSSLL